MMAPRGVYSRKKKAEVSDADIASQIESGISASEAENGENKKNAKDVLAHVSNIVSEIRSSHVRINKTMLEIGLGFFQIKKILDAAPAETRKYGVKTFTNWMNTVAPEVCSMSRRTAWHYYQSYAESLAAGLEEKTIVALSPTLLKSEKPRQTLLKAIQKNPDLAEQLNQAARSPKQLRVIAQSEPIQAVLEKARQV